jgi:hypothetical protein
LLRNARGNNGPFIVFGRRSHTLHSRRFH